MARPKKYPDYDPDKIMNDLLDVVVEECKKSLKTIDKKGEIKSIAAELEIAPHKARKLLITAGIRDGEEYYSSPRCSQILSLFNEGKAISEIMGITGLNRTSVCCYLPYTKGLYNAKEISVDAERIRRYRSRQARLTKKKDVYEEYMGRKVRPILMVVTVKDSLDDMKNIIDKEVNDSFVEIRIEDEVALC